MSTPTSREPDERDTPVPPPAEPSHDALPTTSTPEPQTAPAAPVPAAPAVPAPAVPAPAVPAPAATTASTPTVSTPTTPAPAGHAAPRPYPTTPSADVAPTTAPGTPPGAAAPVAPPSAPAEHPAGETRRGLRAEHAAGTIEHDRDATLELPEPPDKPGFGRHLLGFLLGLVLTPVALLLTGIGTARMADIVGTESPLTDALGLTLLVVGALLLAVIVLLGAWSPTVPITGGLVWGVGLGVAYLVVPAALDDTVEALSADRVVPAAVDQLTEGAMSGQLVVTGILLLAAGIATAVARRIGRRWAEGVAAAQSARADAARAEAARAESLRAGTGTTADPGHTAL